MRRAAPARRAPVPPPTAPLSSRRSSLDFFFHMFFLVRYCRRARSRPPLSQPPTSAAGRPPLTLHAPRGRMLEEGSFRGRPADFLLMLLFGGSLMCAASPFTNIPPFLGSSLAFMMVYVWGRRNEYVRMSFLGLFQFRAPFLPWVLLCFSVMLGNSPTIDLMGIVVGHIYYFLEDVYPYSPAGRGRHPLTTPRLLKLLVGQRDRQAPEETLGVGPVETLAPLQQPAAAQGARGAVAAQGDDAPLTEWPQIAGEQPVDPPAAVVAEQRSAQQPAAAEAAMGDGSGGAGQ